MVNRGRRASAVRAFGQIGERADDGIGAVVDDDDERELARRREVAVPVSAAPPSVTVPRTSSWWYCPPGLVPTMSTSSVVDAVSLTGPFTVSLPGPMPGAH